MYPNIEDSLGVKINRYTVIEVTNRKDKYNHRLVKCKCECGTIKEIQYSYLKNGHIKSCGCLNKEVAGKIGLTSNLQHGKTGTRLHNIWKGMRQRCFNPNTKPYKDYGGKGVSICPKWNDFDNFYNWAMNNGYTDEMTIDRIDSNGHYEPSNCQWITKPENTRRKNKEKPLPISVSRYTKEQGDEIRKLRAEGKTYSYISKIYGCSISHVKRICDNEVESVSK